MEGTAVRPGGVIGFYVWDYPGSGVEFMRTLSGGSDGT